MSLFKQLVWKWVKFRPPYSKVQTALNSRPAIPIKVSRQALMCYCHCPPLHIHYAPSTIHMEDQPAPAGAPCFIPPSEFYFTAAFRFYLLFFVVVIFQLACIQFLLLLLPVPPSELLHKPVVHLRERKTKPNRNKTKNKKPNKPKARKKIEIRYSRRQQQQRQPARFMLIRQEDRGFLAGNSGTQRQPVAFNHLLSGRHRRGLVGISVFLTVLCIA